MRVRGDNAPSNAFSLEEQPNKPGIALVRFYENAEPFEEKRDELTISGWVYDEYHLELNMYDGLSEDILGNYAGYLDKREEAEKPESTARSAPPQKKSAVQTNAPKKKFTYGEQREYDTIEDDIAALETQIAGIEQQMEAAATDYVRLEELMGEKAKLEEQLETKTERWLYLEELAEQIAAQK